MSSWYDIKKEDIEIDGDEINIYVHGDDWGSVYAVIKIKDLKEILSSLEQTP